MSREAIKHYEAALKEAFPSGATGDVFFHWNEARKAIQQAEQAQPKCGAIIEVFGTDWRLEYMSLPVGKHKLYTQQYNYTAPPPRQPMTDDEIWKIWEQAMVEDNGKHARLDNQPFVHFARAIEAAHGITGESE